MLQNTEECLTVYCNYVIKQYATAILIMLFIHVEWHCLMFALQQNANLVCFLSQHTLGMDSMKILSSFFWCIWLVCQPDICHTWHTIQIPELLKNASLYLKYASHYVIYPAHQSILFAYSGYHMYRKLCWQETLAVANRWN